MRNKKEKGLTLIELLVIIALVGLLSSIILVALQDGARNKALDTKIKAEIDQIRKGAELAANSSGGDYSSYSVPSSFHAPSHSHTGGIPNYQFRTDGTLYVIYYPLTSGRILCLDSNGAFVELSGVPTEYACEEPLGGSTPTPPPPTPTPTPPPPTPPPPTPTPPP